MSTSVGALLMLLCAAPAVAESGDDQDHSDHGNKCDSLSLDAAPPSPQTVGVTVTLSATAPGCDGTQYTFWIRPPSGTWSQLQARSLDTTATWATTGLAAGTYSFAAVVRAGASPDQSDEHSSPIVSYTLLAPVPCTSVAWKAPDPPSPQTIGAHVTLSGTAAGCTNPVYQFMIQPLGGHWSILQAYSPVSTATWDTTGLAAGTYSLDVWVRQAGATVDWEAHLSPSPTYDLQASGPCTSVTWDTPVPASPQPPGTQVTLSGTPSGCSNPEYEFWIQAPGGTWTILQAYSPKSSVVWNTGGAATATYLFDIWVRQSGSTADWEAHISPNPTYTLQFGPPCTSVSVTFTPGSPLLSGGGTPVQLSAVAAGCPDATYEFWVQAPGGAWTVLQGYSTSSTATWDTSGLPPGTYLFDVWVREAGNTPDWEAHISPNPTFTLS